MSLGEIPVLTAIYPNDDPSFCGLDFIQQDEMHYGWYPESLLENNPTCKIYGSTIVTRSNLNAVPILTYAKPICEGYGQNRKRHGVVGVNIALDRWFNSYLNGVDGSYIFFSDNVGRFYSDDRNLVVKLFGLEVTMYYDFKYSDIENDFSKIAEVVTRGDASETSIYLLFLYIYIVFILFLYLYN